MSLIEQLGGYEKFKGYVDGALRGMPDSYCYEFDTVLGWKKLLNMRDVKCILLDYRRQHNIFEAGDLIVLPYTNYRSDVFALTKSFKEIYDEKGIAYRHATDEEIKAGRRL